MCKEDNTNFESWRPSTIWFVETESCVVMGVRVHSGGPHSGRYSFAGRDSFCTTRYRRTKVKTNKTLKDPLLKDEDITDYCNF